MQCVITIVELLILGIFMFYLTKREEKTFINELQKLKITIDFKPILEKMDNNYISILQEIKQLDIPELTPVIEEIKKLEEKIETGEIKLKNGIIEGNLTVNGNLKTKGDITAYSEE